MARPTFPERLPSDSSSAGAPGVRPGKVRGRPPEINRRMIIDTARALLENGGRPADLSLRRLAAELNVTAMALYRYVEDKDELLELLVDERVAELGLPEADPADWPTWMRQLSTRLYHLIVADPVAAYVFSTRPVATPAGLRRMEAALTVLHTAGFADADAVSVFAQLHTLTLGFACLASSRAHHAQAVADAAPVAAGSAPGSNMWTTFFRTLPGDTYPSLVAMAPDLAAFTSPTQFENSLDRLLTAFAADFAGASAGRARSRRND